MRSVIVKLEEDLKEKTTVYRNKVTKMGEDVKSMLDDMEKKKDEERKSALLKEASKWEKVVNDMETARVEEVRRPSERSERGRSNTRRGNHTAFSNCKLLR